MRQLSGIFLCILVLGAHATTFLNGAQNKQQIITELQDKNSEFYQLLEEGSQYVVDEVLNLLKNLEDAARNDLQELIKAWAKEKAILTDILKKATAAYNKQVIFCNKLEKQQHNLEKEIRVRRNEISRNVRQIASNIRRIKALNQERCRQNGIFINHMIQHKDAILLFQILDRAIDNYKPGTFVQMEQVQQVAKTLGDYINLYAKEHSAEYQQIFSQLSKKFNFHGLALDNRRGRITLQKLDQNTVRSLANIKGQLKSILAKLLANEQRDRQASEAQEARDNDAASNFKSFLQDESRKLTRRNEKLAGEIAALRVRLSKKIAQVRACRKQEAKLLAAKNLAQKNLDAARARFRARRAVLLGEIALFSKLYVYYKERVYSVATQADKARIQDYVKNKSFKNSGSYTAKTASAFNGLRNNVRKYAERNAR